MNIIFADKSCLTLLAIKGPPFYLKATTTHMIPCIPPQVLRKNTYEKEEKEGSIFGIQNIDLFEKCLLIIECVLTERGSYGKMLQKCYHTLYELIVLERISDLLSEWRILSSLTDGCEY